MFFVFYLAIRGVGVVAELGDVSGDFTEFLHAAGFISVEGLRDDFGGNPHDLYLNGGNGKFPAPELPLAFVFKKVVFNGVIEMRVGNGHFSGVRFTVFLVALGNTVTAEVGSPAFSHACARATDFHDDTILDDCIDVFSGLFPDINGCM